MLPSAGRAVEAGGPPHGARESVWGADRARAAGDGGAALAAGDGGADHPVTAADPRTTASTHRSGRGTREGRVSHHAARLLMGPRSARRVPLRASVAAPGCRGRAGGVPPR